MAIPPKRNDYPDINAYHAALTAYRAQSTKTNDMATATKIIAPAAAVKTGTIQADLTPAAYQQYQERLAGKGVSVQQQEILETQKMAQPEQAAAREQATTTALQKSATINNYGATTPQQVAAQKAINLKYNLPEGTGIYGEGGLAKKPFPERDIKTEATVNKNLGAGTEAQNYIATYAPDKLGDLITTGQVPVNIFNAEELSKLGLTAERLQHLAEGNPTVQALLADLQKLGGEAGIAGANLEATPAPTNTKLDILSEALNAKNNYKNQALGASDLFKMAGLSGYSVLAQSMQQRSAEMRQKGESAEGLIARAGGQMMDTYKALADNYKSIRESYDKQMDRLLDIDKAATEHEFLLSQADTEFAREKELYEFKAKKDAEYKGDSLGNIFNYSSDPFSSAGATKIGDKDFEAQLGQIFGAGKKLGQCGDVASLWSDAGAVGNLWTDKKKAIDEIQGTPSIGDKILVPAGVASGKNPYGHVLVSLTSADAKGDFYTAESNYDGVTETGRISIQNINDLNQKYGKEWGIKNGKLRPSFKTKLESVLPQEQNAVTNQLNALKGNPQAYALLRKEDKDMAFAFEDMAGGKENLNRILAGEDAFVVLNKKTGELPDEVSWVDTAIQNTFGGVVKGNKNVDIKRTEFKNLIEKGKNKEASTMAFNAVFGKLSPAEKTKMTELLNLNRNYDEVMSSLDELKELAGKDSRWQPGLFAGGYSDLLSTVKKARPDEVVKLKARIDRAYANYGKSVSGAAISEPEAQRLLKQFPTLWSPGNEGQVLGKELQRQAEKELDTNIAINSQSMFSSAEELNSALDLIEAGEYGDYREKQNELMAGFGYVGTKLGEILQKPFKGKVDTSEIDNIYK